MGNAAETYKENQVNADIHVKQKVSCILYCCSSRNGRITLYFSLIFFLLMMSMHIKSEIVRKFLLNWHQNCYS